MILAPAVARARTAISLAGAAVLVAYGALRLARAGVHTFPAATPYDHSQIHAVVPAYHLLIQAGRIIPRGAVVFACHEPRDPDGDTYLHRWAVAILPDLHFLPGAIWGWPTPPDLERQAQYVVIVGKRPSPEPGSLLLETPDGSIWRKGVR